MGPASPEYLVKPEDGKGRTRTPQMDSYSDSETDSDDDDWLNICSARASELNGDFIEELIGDLTAGGVGDFTGGFVANGLIGIFSGIIFF